MSINAVVNVDLDKTRQTKVVILDICRAQISFQIEFFFTLSHAGLKTVQKVNLVSFHGFTGSMRTGMSQLDLSPTE